MSLPMCCRRFISRSVRLGWVGVVAVLLLVLPLSPYWGHARAVQAHLAQTSLAQTNLAQTSPPAESPSPAIAPLSAPSSPTANQVDGYPIVLDGRELFRIRQGVPNITSAKERASIINARIIQLANDPSIALNTVRTEDTGDVSIVKAGNDTVLFTVMERDRVDERSRQELATRAVQILQASIGQYREARTADQIIRGIILAILSTIALILFLVWMQRFISSLLLRIRAARHTNVLDVRVRNFQVLDSVAISYLLTGLVRLVRLVLVLSSLYLYIPFLLSQFPATKALGDSIFRDIAYRFDQLTAALVGYLPNLVAIGIVGFLAYYLIGFAQLVISELGREDAYPWFYPEWISPTNRLATFLIMAIALVIAAPYLPGFGSPAFQGVSLFLGALLTLGSSSAVANAISGIILIYTRAFRIGDFIRIGDVVGEVYEKSLFVTRLLTPKKEVITLPNSSVLNSNVVNYTSVSRESNSYLLLHTTITLGYDVPWRNVHAVLVEAAKVTDCIVSEPAPFVLQTSLNDFNVAYELNAYTTHPQLMPKIYSELHQNIQDYCNQAGIEILSPAFTSLRDGNHSTIPANYLPEDYSPPTFQIRHQDNHSH